MDQQSIVRLNLPKFDYKIRERNDKLEIFDVIRRKYIVMTPEEWVRQHFIHFLVDHKNYSKALIRVESGLRYNKVQKRTDILIYTREGAPHMLVECKSYKERISQKTFDQIMVYNRSLSTQYLVVTNGIEHYCCVLEEGRVLKFLEDIPNNGEKSE